MRSKRFRVGLYRVAGIAGLAGAAFFAAVALPGSTQGYAASRPAPRPQAPAVHQKLDLSSRTAILRYLKTKGVSPSAVVFQSGPRNYAGPRCPGKAWNCTRAPVVVQRTNAAGVNKFECTPSPLGTANSSTQTCVVVQGSATSASKNEARCVEHSSVAGQSQSCDITQTNGSGENRAFVDQLIDQGAGSFQSGSQSATVTQMNNTGENFVLAAQVINQRTSVVSSGFQGQEGNQTIDVCQGGVTNCQTQSSNSNAATVYQTLVQRAIATVSGAVTQEQNAPAIASAADAPSQSGTDTFANIEQNSTNGRNTTGLYQQWNQSAEAKNNGSTIHQTQGTFFGGIRGEINQFSNGISEAFAGQTEDQQLTARTPSPASVTQEQNGPSDCCSNQFDNSNNRFKIDQRKSQQKVINPPDDDDGGDRVRGTDDNGGSFQDASIITDCDTSGNCDTSSSINQNGVVSSDSCTGTSCHRVHACLNGSCEAGPPPPTAVTLRGFVARATQDGVELRWRTAQETGLLGFEVYRAGVKLNRTLIAARGPGAAGSAYRFLDRSARIGAASTYRLRVVRADGTRVWIGRAFAKR